MKELSREERRELRDSALEVSVPAVYFDRGYMLLTLSRNSGRINFTRAGDGSYESLSASEFSRLYLPADPSKYPAAYLALNLLGRATEGYWLSVRVTRRLLTMITKEELMKLSERALGKEYSRIMGLPNPINKITTNPEIRARYVDQMLAKLAETPAAAEASAAEAPTTEGSAEALVKSDIIAKTDQPADATTAAAEPGTEAQTAAEGEEDVAKAKAKAKKKPAAKKEDQRAAVYDKVGASVKNPYREGSKKVKAFEIFRAGGDRASILEKIAKLGVTESTASSWVNLFRKVK